MYVCVRQIIAAGFQLQFMTRAADSIDEHGPSNEICRQLQPKTEDLGNTVFAVRKKRQKSF